MTYCADKMQRMICLAYSSRQNISRSCVRYNQYLRGACGLASWYAQYLANKENMFPTFVLGDGHCWLQYFGYIIDPTATQFNEKVPGVFVIKRKYSSRVSRRIGAAASLLTHEMVSMYNSADRIAKKEQGAVDLIGYWYGDEIEYLRRRSAC